jgi:hypothetical protein
MVQMMPWAFLSDECQSLATDDPNLNVRLPVTNQECRYSVAKTPQGDRRWGESRSIQLFKEASSFCSTSSRTPVVGCNIATIAIAICPFIRILFTGASC